MRGCVLSLIALSMFWAGLLVGFYIAIVRAWGL